MAIESKTPEIATLKRQIEEHWGCPLEIHSDFEKLKEDIFQTTKQLISVTTLERLWNYSTRGYETVSRFTLDLLCRYIGYNNWDGFIDSLKNADASESDFFNRLGVITSSLKPGMRLRIGWQPDRQCLLRYLGDNRFIAEETLNSKLQPGDTFSCLQFQLHSPLYVEDLKDSNGISKGPRYGMGLRHGLTMLQLLEPQP